MGFLAKYAQANATRGGQVLRPSPTDGGPGRAIWDQVFGTNKEEGGFRSSSTAHSRSLTGTDASYVQLLKAMRSGAPGGWSDDRYEQWRHFVGVAYVAIHNICKQISMAEFQVFKKDDFHPDGKRPITKNDPPDVGKFCQPWELVQLLERPNRQDSWGRWLYRLMQQKLLTGNALNWLVPNELGYPFEMYIVPTAIAIPQPVINPDYPNGYWRIQPVYPYGPFSSYPTPYSAVGAAIPAEWMRPHFQYPHPFFRYDGYSPLSALRLHLDEVESIDRSRWYSMQKSFNPAAVLNLDPESEPLPPQEVERIKVEFENSFQGPQNTGQLFVGGPGTSLEQFGIRPQEMDYQSGWDQLVSFSMGAFGITKPAAGMIEDASYSNLYATLKQLDLLTIGPECVAGSTPLITRDGAGSIAGFEGEEVEVWNGSRWSRVTVRKTGMDRQLVRVKFSDGSHLDCTPNHRFSVSMRNHREWRVVEAKDLVRAMVTETFAIQHTDGEQLEDAYSLGVLFGDGRVKKGISTVELYGAKMKLPVVGEVSGEKWDPRCAVPYVHVRCGKRHSDRMIALRSDDEDAWWSLFSFDRQSILSFLAGWLDTDGSGDDGGSVGLAVSGKLRASMVQLLLAKCGIRCTISLSSRAGVVTNYGRRSADLWLIWIADCKDIPCHRLDTSRGHTPPCRGKYQTVKSVVWLPGLHDTFCFTEPFEHKGVFNCTLTYQCADIASELTQHVASFFGDGLIIEIRCRKIDDHEIIHQKLQLLMAAKAITKNEFRHELEMPLTQEPWGNEIAGMDPMMMMPPAFGQPTATPLDAPTMELELLDEEERVAYEEAQVDEMENGRPGPDGMARGAGGVREDTPPNNKKKDWADLMNTKSLYDKVREVCRNGH